MHEYDFDEMAKHFNAMRESYLDYRRGGSQPAVERKLSKFLMNSDLFFRKYPNPFSDSDENYIPQSEEFKSRSGYRAIEKQIDDYRKLKENIEERIQGFKRDNASKEIIKRFESYLSKCQKKIDIAEKELDSIIDSNLPI